MKRQRARNSGLKLDSTDFANHAAGLSNGQQKRVSHTGCPAGEDTKRRLWVKRLADGSVVAFCHHCGRSGRSKHGARQVFRASPPEAPDTIRLPPDFDPRFDNWPAKAKAWVSQYGIFPNEIGSWGYSERIGRVVIPIFNGSDLLGYQMRRVHEQDPGPKYLTRGRNLVYAVGHRSKSGVVCEDALSAVKLSRFCKAYALLGTTLRRGTALKIADECDRVLVWLDNNNAQVLGAARSAEKLLQPLVNTRLETERSDPKCCSEAEILSVLSVLEA